MIQYICITELFCNTRPVYWKKFKILMSPNGAFFKLFFGSKVVISAVRLQFWLNILRAKNYQLWKGSLSFIIAWLSSFYSCAQKLCWLKCCEGLSASSTPPVIWENIKWFFLRVSLLVDCTRRQCCREKKNCLVTRSIVVCVWLHFSIIGISFVTCLTVNQWGK